MGNTMAYFAFGLCRGLCVGMFDRGAVWTLIWGSMFQK